MATHRGGTRPELSADEEEVVGLPGDLVSEDVVPARPRTSSVMVSLRLDRATFDALSRLAEQRGETFSTTARDAVRAFLRAQGEGQPYPEAGRLSAGRRISDNTTRAWHDDDLRAELTRYEDACRNAGMRDSAWRSYADYARRFLAWREGAYQPRGTVAGDRPVAFTAATTAELRHQAEEYAEYVRNAGRERPTVETYFRHAMFFIRWLDGTFVPGARLHGLR